MDRQEKLQSNPEVEEWRPIKGYEGLYEVSNLGRVKSLPRPQVHATGKIFTKRTNYIKQAVGRAFNGYTSVALSKDKSQKGYFMHRIIAQAFISNPDNKPFVNHINGVKTDNRVENLEWCTRSENAKHSFRIGLQSNKGERHPCHKLNEQQVAEIRRRHSDGETAYSLHKEYELSYTNMKDIVKRRIWTHI